MPYLAPGPLQRAFASEADVDKNTTLCFACSGSLPPPKSNPQPSLPTPQTDTFTTPCCQRFICLSCITATPRLLRYNTCLACLGGVGVVRSTRPGPAGPPINIDGAMKDEDTFVLGDDSDFEDEKEEDPTTALDADSAFQDISNSFESKALHQATPSLTSVDMKLPELQKDEQRVADALPVKYQINRSDTLQGIVLRYGLDAYELCRLNNLPPSTLKTTPHVLHTRRFLIFPLNTGRTEFLLNNETPDRVREREARRGKERAEKRLQMLTKEADWRVAKAYVAIADDLAAEAEKTEEWHRERKEYAGDNAPVATVRPLNLEERAIMKYLDDNEWEEAQRREWSRRR